MQNHLRRLITLGAVVALLAPVVINHDSFPFSSYPMFSRERGDSVEFFTAVGIDADGEAQPLGLHILGQSDDPLIVASFVRQTSKTYRSSLSQWLHFENLLWLHVAVMAFAPAATVLSITEVGLERVRATRWPRQGRYTGASA